MFVIKEFVDLPLLSEVCLSIVGDVLGVHNPSGFIMILFAVLEDLLSSEDLSRVLCSL